MTREQAKKYTPLIEAFGNGGLIQVYIKPFGWLDCVSVVNSDQAILPRFVDTDEYRIKPQPKEFYICNKGSLRHTVTPEEFCDGQIDYVNTGWEIIHVEEKNFNPYK